MIFVRWNKQIVMMPHASLCVQCFEFFHCFDTVGWVTGKASGCFMISCGICIIFFVYWMHSSCNISYSIPFVIFCPCSTPNGSHVQIVRIRVICRCCGESRRSSQVLWCCRVCSTFIQWNTAHGHKVNIIIYWAVCKILAQKIVAPRTWWVWGTLNFHWWCTYW